jgi:hypothetical protein
VDLERDPLSLVSTTEELLGRKSSGSGLEAENTAVGIRRADHVAHAPTTGKISTKSALLQTIKTKLKLILDGT